MGSSVWGEQQLRNAQRTWTWTILVGWDRAPVGDHRALRSQQLIVTAAADIHVETRLTTGKYHPLHHVLLTVPAEVDSDSSQMHREPHLLRTKMLQNTGSTYHAHA